MAICSCGNETEANSVRCARCNALQTLELKLDANAAEIQSAFDVLSKAWNPERFQGDDKMKAVAEERLKAIEAAYSILTKGSLQAAPFRSLDVGMRVAAPVAEAPGKEAAGRSEELGNIGYAVPASKRFQLPLPLAIGCGVVIAGVVTAWILFKPLDSALMGIPVAGKVYAEYKTGIRSEVQKLKNQIGLGVGPAPIVPAPDAATATTNAQAQHEGRSTGAVQRTVPEQTTGAATGSARNGSAGGRALPFVTAGLTRSEVIAAEGAPTAETPDEMDYGSSKLYFDSGAVVGWRVDPSSPLRVKLWPGAAVDPNLQSFGMGSTKDEVIAVEGTPTMYSQTTFGYGKSEVYFQYGRVVGWKNDAATPLKAASR